MFSQVTEELLSASLSSAFPCHSPVALFLNFRRFQTCRSMPSLPSRRVRTCCKETECPTTSKASTSLITSGGSDMTGLFTRAPKTRRTSSRYVWGKTKEKKEEKIHSKGRWIKTATDTWGTQRRGRCHIDTSRHAYHFIPFFSPCQKKSLIFERWNWALKNEPLASKCFWRNCKMSCEYFRN